jgi:dihydrofolate synthase / folylpolyglutamate synthase
MSYPEAIEFLYSLRWFGAKFGLTNTLKLAALAGNPHHRLRFIHVAGTNGKGSTCAMLESIYRAAGLRVGLFTSPHLVAFGERIQVNRRLISEAEVVQLVTETQPWLAQFRAEQHPTFFEVVTVMALRYFAEQACDLVIWETGLGGRLDATNIVTPLASVITNIQFDHQKWLGETLASIAAEKAGIIKPGIPTITAADAPEALDVIAETARAKGSTLTRIGPEQAQSFPLNEIQLPLLGQHQRLNAALAIATVRAAAERIPIHEQVIREGLSRLDWPGRLQVIKRPQGQTIVLDGAHNPGAAQILATALRQFFPGAKPALILGILRDKDWPGICQILVPEADRLLLVPVSSERSATPQELASACRHANAAAQVAEYASFAAALADTAGEPLTLVTGSLFLVGEALELLQGRELGWRSERELNEWHTPILKPG